MRIFVKFNREVLLAETPFTLTVYANKKQNIKNISGFMEGDNMYMGKVPLLFAKNGEHQFNAQGFIGSCGKQDMQWRIWITFIEQSDKSHTFSITVPSYLR
ncbi:hypothetical protein [Thalassotalea sediminis]|uniref:hypothetical protein n=1 Tax=Thalassotalea sediminis TaxID=1759089 RepID=UPI0025748BAA|nr:hypothetical protein [Thalassotalea sediminis]